MGETLQSLSSELADAVASAGRAVVAIHARRRIPASGVHWKPGVIVATNHTITRDDRITVTLPDATTAVATLAGRDPSTDLAVLKLARTDLPTVSPRPDTPSVGELVLALGRPGPGLTASWGVVSGVAGPWRTWQGGEIDTLVRLDVAIYDGFSGGPLVDAAGRVLGINTSALARGAALTIPVATVERVAAELLERGAVRRAYLGIGTQPVRIPASLVGKLALASDLGLLVVSVEAGGPADKGGLLIGDVLLELDGSAVHDAGDILAKLGRDRVGKALAARVIRGGQVSTLSLTAGERPESRAA
ncbi:MAG TPA: trypsin-like peptidase domain-containing protein [Gemmatimonadales bacterium]|nr:trypsin-like peptidase domain-containing protein [Gemmatimonadales bacterium]